MTTEEFIQKAKEVHGDRYDYSKVQYINTKTKICIICKEHGEFLQRANNHIKGHGCHKCAVKASSIPKPRIWTKEKVFEEARKYTTKHLFHKKSRGAYGAAERNGWFDEMIWFETSNPNKPRVWSKNIVFEFAKNFHTKIEFRKANKSAYNVACKNNWLIEMNWLDISVREPYTKAEVLSIARKYTTKNDFRKSVPNVYNSAQKKGWLKEMTWFVTAPKYDQHNYCVYVYVDEDNMVAYVGLTVDRQRRHFNHSTGYDRKGKTSKSPVYIYFQSIGKVVPHPIYLEEKLTASEARKKEHNWILKYQSMGYRLLNTAKTGEGIGSLGSAALKWTKPRVFKEAQKYQSRTDFATKCSGAYTVATKRGWINQMSWMKEKWAHPSSKWTKDSVFEESQKYSTRREFQDKAKGAYSKALQHGWLEDMHWLKLIRRTWTKEDVMAEAQKYTTRTHFAQNASGAYGIARRNGWLDEFFPKNK